MPKLSEVFPSNYLKADDLQDRDIPVVIASATVEPVGDERKLVLGFQNKQKKMICNKTNANRIGFLYGDDTDNWIGKEVVLTSEFVEFQGQTRKGLRIKPPGKKGQPVTQQRPGYKLSTTAPAPAPTPAETAADEMAEDIPF